jgi:PhoH-like ATPase
MVKNFVLDANVLLYEPNAVFMFEDNNILIPITVIEEIDQFKKDLNEIGRNARQVSRNLDKLREKNNLSQGVKLDNGGTLRVEIDQLLSPRLSSQHFSSTNDNKILSTALNLQEKSDGAPVILITKDTNLRIKADSFGLRAQDFERDQVSIDDMYTGKVEVEVSSEEFSSFKSGSALSSVPGGCYPNTCVVIRDKADQGRIALGRYHNDKKAIIPVNSVSDGVWGIKARNPEQSFAMDLLLDDNVKLVTLTGISGTGKTLLALAAGLLKCTDDKVYKRLLVSRPIFPLGKDMGFLPGDVEEKLSPWMKPIFDNMDLLFGTAGREGGKGGRVIDFNDLMKLGIIEIEPLTYIRGRSLPNQFLIVDEAQNLTPHEIKTIITRAGERTKIVLTGDPYQIDNPYIDSCSNGLSFVENRFKDQAIAGHITLVKGERSELAELAAGIL